jgi:hypothetical protein
VEGSTIFHVEGKFPRRRAGNKKSGGGRNREMSFVSFRYDAEVLSKR